MQLKYDELASHVRSAVIAPLYVVCGDEHLLVLEAMDALRKLARAQGYDQRYVFVVQRNFAWAEIFAAAQSQSLFTQRTLIELRMPTGKPGKEGAQALKDYAAYMRQQGAMCDVLTLITLPRLDAVTQKATWVSALDQCGITIKVDNVDHARLPQWLTQRLAAQGQRFEPGEQGKRTLDFLVERVEGNLLAAHQELQKLGLLYPPGVLPFVQVQEAVLNVARYSVFKLSEAMLAGDVPRLSRMLEGLQGEGEAVVLTLWALTEDIRLLCQLRVAIDAGQSLTQWLREHRIWGARERLIPQALKRLSTDQLHRALALAARLDRQAKGLSDTTLLANIWDGLFDLGLCIANPSAAAQVV